MQRGEDLTVVEVDSQQILDERDALIEHRSRQVRRFGGRRYQGRTEVTIKEDQARRQRKRMPLKPRS